MRQVNVSPQPPDRTDGGRAAAAGVNLVTVVVVLLVALVLLWFLFTGPLAALRGTTGASGPSNVNVSVNVTP
jgi:hypothetical protein